MRPSPTLFLRVFCLMLALVGSTLAWSQSKADLESKRKKLAREIEVTNRLLKKTTATKAATYERFVTLQSQIERRENLIQTIEDEIVAADSSVVRTTLVVESLRADIARMQEEYGVMVRSAYRHKMTSNPLLFLLSAENLNQAFRRWMFLRKYDRYRKGQAEAIAFTQEILLKKIAGIEVMRAEKEQLLASMQGQRGTLAEEMNSKNELLANLSQDETRLSQELHEKQAARAKLDAAIERTIDAEVAKKAEVAAAKKRKAAADAQAAKDKAAAEKPAPVTTPTAKPSAPAPPTTKPERPAKPAAEPVATPAESTVGTYAAAEEDQVSRDFRRHKGKLAMPVSDGFVARRFGRQKHPTLKNIDITNNGIDIRTSEDAPVHAVFEGKVAGVQYIPGHEYTVILQHGDYYSVYSNLSETTLTKGDIVAEGQTLGRVSTNPISGAAELHFELWYEKERMNPALWLR
jgi:murein hydrolase activator